MNGSDVYAASLIKPKRHRATKAAMRDRAEDLIKIVEEGHPMSVRQVFYQATVRGLVDKSETGYGKIQRMLADLRRSNRLSWGWIADYTRWKRKPITHESIEKALEAAAQCYRRALWANVNAYVEVWIEKDALTGVLMPVTERYDVPLLSARGYASLSFLHSSAQYICTVGKPTFIYHLGDHDPSGVNAGEKIEETLREFAPEAEIHFERLAVNPDQIKEWALPSRPTKTTDSRARKFGHAQSVELDAIHPDKLRGIVEQAITRHISKHELAVIETAEKSERDLLKLFGRYAKVHEATA
jgi:hypothetical protein